MNQIRASIIPDIVQEHADEAATLHAARSRLTTAPHAALDDLERFDERLAAHLDGLSIAGEDAWKFCAAALEALSAGSLFTATVHAIETKQVNKLNRVFALGAADPAACSGLVSAFGWVSPSGLRGLVASLLASTDAFDQHLGVAACALHRVDFGLNSQRWLENGYAQVRARALRTAGELGLRALVPQCATATENDDPDCRFWGAYSAVLLGDRTNPLNQLAAVARTAGAHRQRAFRLVLQVMTSSDAHAFLQELAADKHQARWLIQGTGIAGDPAYASWLVARMRAPKTARLAAEAFSLITGANLPALKLDRPKPAQMDTAPDDETEMSDIDMDAEEGLPVPDADRVKAWWDCNANRFHAGTRYFMGAPVTRAQCLNVLTNGYQRQRVLAAQHLCLLEPGTPLFNTSMPAWRQRRLLAKMN